jgi:Bacterial regulatory proteins, lacI family
LTTMRDVARVAGVTAKTVSRVFNDDPHVTGPNDTDRGKHAMYVGHVRSSGSHEFVLDVTRRAALGWPPAHELRASSASSYVTSSGRRRWPRGGLRPTAEFRRVRGGGRVAQLGAKLAANDPSHLATLSHVQPRNTWPGSSSSHVYHHPATLQTRLILKQVHGESVLGLLTHPRHRRHRNYPVGRCCHDRKPGAVS